MGTPRLRIGVFGGTFNPIHLCHLAIARHTRERVQLDRILFVPTGDAPHKSIQSMAPAQHRFEMVRLAIAPDSFFSLSDIEIRRAAKSYSIDTVNELRQEFGAEAELFFITGLDAFLEIGDWKRAPDLVRSIHFIVVFRPGSKFASLSRIPLLSDIESAGLASLDTGRSERVDLPLSPTTKLILLRLPPCDISASDVRRRLAKGRSVANLLPDSVQSYILCHGLYREAANRPGSES